MKHRLWTRSMREAAVDAVLTAEAGSVVTIHPPEATDPQRKRMHAMIGDIAKARPNGWRKDTDTWRMILLRAFGEEVQFETGLDGKPFPIGLSSKTLGKRKTSEFIEFLFAIGAEYGVVWSDEAKEPVS